MADYTGAFSNNGPQRAPNSLSTDSLFVTDVELVLDVTYVEVFAVVLLSQRQPAVP